MSEPHDAAPNTRLAYAREKAGYGTASEAARAFGWNENTYRSHENGERGIRTDTAQKYAKAFKTTPGYILFGLKKGKDDIWSSANDTYSFYDTNYYKRITGFIDDDGTVVDYPVESYGGHEDSFVDTDIIIAESNSPVEFRSKIPIHGCFSGDLLVVSPDKVDPSKYPGKLAIIETLDGHQYFRRIRLGPDPMVLDVSLQSEFASDYRRFSEVRLVSLIIQSSFWKPMNAMERNQRKAIIQYTSYSLYDFRKYGPDGPAPRSAKPHE